MDLRIQKTRQNIFQAFIELREKYPLEKITVKELTERAQISKQTFYLHYRDLLAVVEELVELVITENTGAQPYVCCLTAERYACPYGICDQIRTHPDYAALFFDDTLHERVIRKIAEHSLGRYISALAGQCTLTAAQAETIFYFQLNGCLAVNRQIFRSGGANWEESRDLIGGFIQSGLLRYRK